MIVSILPYPHRIPYPPGVSEKEEIFAFLLIFPQKYYIIY